MSTIFKLTLGLVFAVGLAGCNPLSLSNPFTAHATILKTLPVMEKPRILVDTFNGNIDVLTGAKHKVDVKVVKRAGGPTQEEADADLENIAVTIEADGDSIRIVARALNSKPLANRGAAVEVQVPEGSVLELRTSNGAIASAGAVGNLNAKTSNGGIEANASHGELTLETSNGPIHIEGGVGRIKAVTSNGPVEIVSDKAVLDVRTSNGAIKATGKLPAGNHTLRTSNGGIALTLPASAGFHLTANTTNGNITNAFNDDAAPERKKKKKKDRKTHMEGAFGSDNPAMLSLALRTSNGAIDIKQQ